MDKRVRRRLVAALSALYVVALVSYSLAFGIPAYTVGLSVWIIAALCIVAVASPKRRVIQVFLDWLPFMVVLFAWYASRGIAVKLNRPVQVSAPVDIDRAIGFGHVPTVWLQQQLHIQDGSTHVWQVIPTLIYISHFIAAPVVAAVLWVKNRGAWIAFLKRFATLMIAGLITYIIVPWAPPWRAASFGLLPPLHRSVGDGWQYLHLRTAGDMLEVGQAGVNLDAAMPSLHCGLSLLIVLFLWRRVKPGWRVVLAAYAFGMAFTLVSGAEHYVNDVLAGWLYAVVVHYVWNRLEERSAGRTRAKRTGTRQQPAPSRPLTGAPADGAAERPVEHDPVLD